MENEKYLFVVSGAAGTGKDSVVKALREAHPEIEKTVSATTRLPRPGEQEGVDYYYRTREQFQNQIYRHSLRWCTGRSKRELHLLRRQGPRIIGTLFCRV